MSKTTKRPKFWPQLSFCPRPPQKTPAKSNGWNIIAAMRKIPQFYRVAMHVNLNLMLNLLFGGADLGGNGLAVRAHWDLEAMKMRIKKRWE